MNLDKLYALLRTKDIAAFEDVQFSQLRNSSQSSVPSVKSFTGFSEKIRVAKRARNPRTWDSW